jgi:intraflagellar transport protein 52
VLFSGCKGETHTHKQGLKQLFRRLRSMYRPERLDSKDDFTLDNLSSAAIVVFGCPREKFSTSEFQVLSRYVEQGGSVLILLQEGGETKTGTNINYWLEEYGMSVNADSVLRTTHYKYMHPKEVLIGDGILNRGLLNAVGKTPGAGEDDDFSRVKARQAFDGTGLDFVYPHGCTLSVLKPAVPVLSSGKIAYPMNRPLGEWQQNAEQGVGGRSPPCKHSKRQPTKRQTVEALHMGQSAHAHMHACVSRLAFHPTPRCSSQALCGTCPTAGG